MAIEVKRKKPGWKQKLFLPAVYRGLGLIMRIVFRKKFTRQYPEEPMPTSDATKGQPRLVQNKDGAVRCVSCGLCEYVCPAFAITIVGKETEREIEREPKEFSIDMLRCILCGFCEEVCPEEAIFMSKNLELAGPSRGEHVLTMDKLLVPEEKFEERIQYTRKIFGKWRKPSSTS